MKIVGRVHKTYFPYKNAWNLPFLMIKTLHLKTHAKMYKKDF